MYTKATRYFILGQLLKIIYFVIIFFIQFFAQTNSAGTFADESFVFNDTNGLNSGPHLLFTTNFNVDLIRDKIKASAISGLEINSLSDERDKIKLINDNLLINITNFDQGFFNESAKESLFELGYKAITSRNNSTFWLDGFYQGDLDCSVAFCKNSHDFDWSAGARFDFTKLSITGRYRNKKKNVFSFNKFQSGVLKRDASFEEIHRGGYQLLGKYEVNQDTRLNFTLGDVPTEYDSNESFEIYRSNYQKSLWTVGVHHDVNSWLKIVAEYNRAQYGINNTNDGKEDSISVGGVLKW